MDTFEALLSPEVLAGIVAIAALGMAVRALLAFSSDNSELRPKLDKIENDLNRYRDGMKEQKEIVEELEKVVRPLADSEEELRTYYEQLKALEMEVERQEAKTAADDEEARRRRIQRKRMGYES